jgi:hypothetical protein
VITGQWILADKHFGKDFVKYYEEGGHVSWVDDLINLLLRDIVSIMEFEFIHAEKDLALEAWMTQTFKLEDKMLEEDLAIEGWMLADTTWFEMN